MNNNKLSKRLSACADFVPQGAHVADVGCDHGYLSIYLLQNGIASKVYAGDINEGPLQSAVLNAEKAGLKERISFYLSDGVKNIPKNFDTLVCAGMGADTMISILENAPWLQNKQYRLILQCQSKIHCLRQYLYEKGWHIVREKALKDGRFLYTVMEAVFEKTDYTEPRDYYFPPALLHCPTEELSAYYQQTVQKLQRIADGQKEHTDPVILKALYQLDSESLFQHLKEESH